jgi:hypothetical protein
MENQPQLDVEKDKKKPPYGEYDQDLTSIDVDAAKLAGWFNPFSPPPQSVVPHSRLSYRAEQ